MSASGVVIHGLTLTVDDMNPAGSLCPNPWSYGCTAVQYICRHVHLCVCMYIYIYVYIDMYCQMVEAAPNIISVNAALPLILHKSMPCLKGLTRQRLSNQE